MLLRIRQQVVCWQSRLPLPFLQTSQLPAWLKYSSGRPGRAGWACMCPLRWSLHAFKPCFQSCCVQQSFSTYAHVSHYPKSFVGLVWSLGRLGKYAAMLAATGLPRSWRVMAFGTEMVSVPINLNCFGCCCQALSDAWSISWFLRLIPWRASPRGWPWHSLAQTPQHTLVACKTSDFHVLLLTGACTKLQRVG